MPACKTCELIRARDEKEAPPWDSIHRTAGWDVVHSYDTSLEGWLVLVARRHITAVAEMTDEEAAELGPLIRAVSAALHDVVGCEKTYIAQFAEHLDHPHVHVHVIARRADLPEHARGARVFSQVGVEGSDRVSEGRMNEIASSVRSKLRDGDD